MPSPETIRAAPIAPLLAKEWREIVGGRALWTMLLLLCPLVGFSFVQAVELYGEASAAAPAGTAAAAGLSPFDGILVPTLGAVYVATTLLFPFVAIRALGHEKESGALRLLVQLPYRPATIVAVKLAAVLAAWLLAAIPALSAIVAWRAMGGHLAGAETAVLLFGHVLYGLLVGAIALFAAAIAESSATAAIVTLAFTIGSWVLDFATAGQSGWLGAVSRLSLTQALRTFEQGLLSGGLIVGIAATILGFAALTVVWLPPGAPLARRLARSSVAVMVLAIGWLTASQIAVVSDATEDQRNSFSPADQRALASLARPLAITIHMASEDPRYVDLRRNVLVKLERAVPHLAIRLVAGRQSAPSEAMDDHYGEIVYDYDGRQDVSRSTSPREILPLIYGLANIAPPAGGGADYPGYPLIAAARPALIWFFAVLPAVVVACWWGSRRPPRPSPVVKEAVHEH